MCRLPCDLGVSGIEYWCAREHYCCTYTRTTAAAVYSRLMSDGADTVR